MDVSGTDMKDASILFCRNQQRDKEVILKLQQQGWRVIIVWECEIQKSQLPRIIDKIDSIIKCP